MAEVIATYLLVFVSCGVAALSGSDEPVVTKLGASITCGLIVTVMIYSVGHISGAHMNPAVTIAFAAVRRFPWRQVIFFFLLCFSPQFLCQFTILSFRFFICYFYVFYRYFLF